MTTYLFSFYLLNTDQPSVEDKHFPTGSYFYGSSGWMGELGERLHFLTIKQHKISNIQGGGDNAPGRNLTPEPSPEFNAGSTDVRNM